MTSSLLTTRCPKMLQRSCQLCFDTHLKRMVMKQYRCLTHTLNPVSLSPNPPSEAWRSSGNKTLFHSMTPKLTSTGGSSESSCAVNNGSDLLGQVKLEPSTESLFQGLVSGDRASLAKAITLVESSNMAKRRQAQLMMTLVLQHLKAKGKKGSRGPQSFRIGLSGPPGAGKSTFVEYFGKYLTSMDHRVAVLAVDPSSNTTGGSLLADKTRMPQLSVDPNAFIRPSPSRGTLGGVAEHTNEAIVLCEGAGFDIILVETVGVGQSEIKVSDMVDLFCLLIPPAGGDELQGIKRGIIEVTDLVVVTKSDGGLESAAQIIQAEYISALKFMKPHSKVWRPLVMRISAKTKTGVEKLWDKMCEYRLKTTETGELKKKREHQLNVWMWNYIHDRILYEFRQQPVVAESFSTLEAMVQKGAITPSLAADVLLGKFFKTLS